MRIARIPYWAGFWIAVAAVVVFFDGEPSLKDALVSYLQSEACR